jgi:molecular chaperone GrpE
MIETQRTQGEGRVDDRRLMEGVRLTDEVLKSVLKRHGVEKIDSLSARFDPRLHEAVLVIDDDSREPGVITQVAEEGYKINDRLLRPARVFVNNPNLQPADSLREGSRG